MRNLKDSCRGMLVLVLGLTPLSCGSAADEAGSNVESATAALMNDGDPASIAPGMLAGAPAPAPAPARFCTDCASTPLGFWTFDDCNAASTQLTDSASSTPFPHSAFRAVSTACAAGIDGQGVRFAHDDDIVYAPDQPDFEFDQGLTIAAWVNPDRVTGTQSIVRKRFDGSSSFLLAIDGKRVELVLKLDHGRLVTVSAPLKVQRFTHVAATYDGRQALLYLDGVVVAQTRAKGTIVPGVGPIFIGNDANGRNFEGIIDSVWLNTLAARADEIKNLSCVRKPPLVSLSPTETPPQVAGATVPFDLSVTNRNGPTCPSDLYEFEGFPQFPLTADATFGELSAAPGETVHTTIDVKSSRAAAVGSYPIEYQVFDEAAFQFSASADASYVVGTGPVACDGSPPFTPQIIGSFLSPAGTPFSFAASGLSAPLITTLPAPDGSIGALQVSVDPGTATDLANNFAGFGLAFGNPACLDASQFTGVQFTITGDLGACAVTFSVVPSQDNSVEFGPLGTCTASTCLAPLSGPIGTGTTVLHFSDLTGGSPLASVDSTALNDVSWNITLPTDGSTPCVARFTVSDVSFISD